LGGSHCNFGGLGFRHWSDIGRFPLGITEEVGCFPPVVSEKTFATFLPTPRHECGGTSPNICQMQLSTTLRDRRLRFLIISRGPIAEWTIIQVFFDPLFLDCHAIGNHLPVDHDELGCVRTIEQDLRPLNIGLVSAWQRAQDRERWKRTVETATLQDGACS